MNAHPLCNLNFHHVGNGRSIRAEIGQPVSEIKHPLGAPELVRDWGSRIVVEVDGVTHSRVIWSGNWSGAFLLALRYVRHFIPEGEEREWVDDDGLESWCVLPKEVPISWGYDLYARISAMVDQAEKEFVSEVERRRLASEKRKKQDDE